MSKRSLRNKLSRTYRQLTSPVRRLPDFLVIGVVKGGTTSIYKYMVQHPMIASATAKEIHYFKRKFFATHNSYWYRSHFPLSQTLTRSLKLTGEASPEYFHNPEAPQNIYQLVPEAKLILLLRNPIDRAYSHYEMNMKNRKKKLGLDPHKTFTQIVHDEIEILKFNRPSDQASKMFEREPLGFTYLGSGMYIYSLRNWFQVFPKEKILILKSEDLFDNPEILMNQVFEFLGLDPFKANYSPLNVGDYTKLDASLRKNLLEFFQPYNEALFAYLNRDFDWGC